jgi:serine/threonine protein kinase/Tfp pilus assembly protein PilF
MIGEIVSHYRIIDHLGEGGMGTVYLAEDTRLGRRVALKFPTITTDEHHYKARFLREARAASTLTHPHIAAVYDYGETDDGHPFLVMELVNGPSLSDLLHESRLTLSRAVEIIRDIAAALSEAHQQGIIHRDIKPSNVVLNHRDEVKVLDFGLAKQINEEQAQTADPDAQTMIATRTRSGAVVGTPLYLSPEQATSAPVDARSDLFALGALLYECIAGRPAFNGGSAIEIAAQVIHVDPPPPSSINPRVPAELDRITMKALQKRPEARYQNADEMIADLHAVRAELSGENAPEITQRLSIAPRTGRTSALTTLSDTLRRPRLSLGFFLLAIMIPALAMLGYWWWSRKLPHVPLAEAARWYEVGTNALRDGAYYQASRAFEQAVRVDDKFVLAHARLAEAWTELDYSDRAKDEMLRISALAPDRSVLPPLDALYLQAITTTATRDFAGAIKAYQEIARQTPDAEKPRVLVDLGRAQEKNEDLKAAIENYMEATRREPQYATAHLRLGILYGRNQELSSATASFDKAEAIYQTLGNVESRTEVIYQRGALFNRLGKINEARAQLQQALDMAHTTGNQYQQINVLLQLSSVAYDANDMDQARRAARDAVDLAQSSGMEALTARGLVDLGSVFLVRGDYVEAEKYFKQALELAQRYKTRRNEARALLSLGSLRIEQTNADEAVRYVQQALAFYQSGNYRQETSLALTLLGRANRLKGDYEGALHAFEQQLELAQKAGNPAQVSLSQTGIGTVLAQQERYGEALAHYEESYHTSQTLNDQRSMGYSLANRGQMLWQLGRYAEAGAAFDKASAIAGRTGGGYDALKAQLYLYSAEMALSERRFPEAQAKSQQALDLAGTQYKDVVIQAKCALSVARAVSGKAREARGLCDEAAQMAASSGDPWLLSKAWLALAPLMLESGDAQNALTTALRAQEQFARTGQQDSRWRALLIAARASRKLGDETAAREYGAQANELLSNLQQKWGAEVYDPYLARPDVQYLRKQLGEFFATSE